MDSPVTSPSGQKSPAAPPAHPRPLGVTHPRDGAGGPVRGTWPNYGKLSQIRHHCHLKKGHPTYVAVWEVRDRQVQIIEVLYVGTHENAPY
jgi:hypothetical protein